MKTELAELLALLKLELDDLYQNAEKAVRDYVRRKEQHAVTEHVCDENVALLQNEELCLRRFREILDTIDAEAFRDAGEMTAEIRRRFAHHVDEGGCAPCTLFLAEERMENVLRVMRNLASCRR